LPPQAPQKLNRLPLIIKVSNYPASLRPQSGLSFADLVWEYDIGLGMTRFSALYYGRDAPQVGPMRSGRLPDAQIVPLYGGVLAMVGADAFVLGELRAALGERLVIYKPDLCPAICRRAPGVNGIFADSAALSEFVQDRGLEGEPEGLAGMAFSAAPPPGGQKVDRLWIYYSLYDQVGWDWDAAAGAFLRSQEVRLPDGGVALEPLVDRLTGQQLAFGNVVLLIAYHEELKPALIDIHLSHPQSGAAWVLRDGRIYRATYRVALPDAPLRLFDLQGQPLALKPGSTWFMIVGHNSIMEEGEPAFWTLRHRRR
jgi:hypothetical protein